MNSQLCSVCCVARLPSVGRAKDAVFFLDSPAFCTPVLNFPAGGRKPGRLVSGKDCFDWASLGKFWLGGLLEGPPCFLTLAGLLQPSAPLRTRAPHPPCKASTRCRRPGAAVRGTLGAVNIILPQGVQYVT